MIIFNISWHAVNKVNFSTEPNCNLLCVTGLLKASAPSRIVVTASMAHSLIETLNPKVHYVSISV